MPSYIWTLVVIVLAAGCATRTPPETSQNAERKAIGFLKSEVPAWYRGNGCFSCHNNGDGARALYVAIRKGYRLPSTVLADTSSWLIQPARWSHNKGDPGFSDQRLADIQFAASLASALDARIVTDRTALKIAAERIAAAQNKNGAWPIDTQNPVGSPATYGALLATRSAVNILQLADAIAFRSEIDKAKTFLSQAQPHNLISAATLLQAEDDSRKRESLLKIIGNAQTADGGWGPYADSPPEPFDTAVVLLALKDSREKNGVDKLIQRGRAFLISQQNPDGGWPATTRPAGGVSYAQRVSTTAWATIALLETGD